MKQIRQKIDGIDRILIAIIGRRMEFVAELGKLKKKKSLPIKDDKREAEILAKVEKLAEKHGLNHLFVKKLYAEIIKESKRIQAK